MYGGARRREEKATNSLGPKSKNDKQKEKQQPRETTNQDRTKTNSETEKLNTNKTKKNCGNSSYIFGRKYVRTLDFFGCPVGQFSHH